MDSQTLPLPIGIICWSPGFTLISGPNQGRGNETGTGVKYPQSLVLSFSYTFLCFLKSELPLGAPLLGTWKPEGVGECDRGYFTHPPPPEDRLHSVT